MITLQKHVNLIVDDGEHTSFLERGGDDEFYGFVLDRIVARLKTSFQDVLIVDSANYGRMLVLDGSVQSAELDEALYHEVLVHPAMLAHRDPADILIVGGGEGATCREVLKHRSVRTVTMVDIDGDAVELCKTHLSQWHQGSFDDPRVRLVIEDGRRFLEKTRRRFDVAVIDVVDLLDHGPSFPGPRGFLLASDWFDPLGLGASSFDNRIASRVEGALEHADGRFIVGLFSHCKAIRAALDAEGPVLQDGMEFTGEE